MDWYNSESHSHFQVLRNVVSEFTWTTLLALLIFICITTRIRTGQLNTEPLPGQTRAARLAPYWFPWIGHGFQFLWDHVGLLESIRWDSYQISHFTFHISLAPRLIPKQRFFE